MFNLLADLPNQVAVSILCGFLNEKSMVKVDSAFCSVPKRNRFLELLSCDEFKLKAKTPMKPLSRKDAPRLERFVRWCVARGVKVSVMQLSSHMKNADEDLCARHIQICGNQLDALSVSMVPIKLAVINSPGIYFDSLVELHWYQEHDGGEELAAILSRAPKLKWLYVSSLHALNESHFIGIQLERLQNLSLTGYFQRQNLKWLVDACPNVLVLRYYPDSGVPDPLNVFASLPLLQKLVCGRALSDEDVGRIADCCPGLTHFEMHSAWALTDAGLASLCSKCSALRSLQVNSNHNLTSTSLQIISDSLAEIVTHLTFTRCRHVLQNLQRVRFPKLELLDISDCGTHHFMDAPVNLEQLLMSCPVVREINVNGHTITDAPLTVLAEHCPHVHTLSLLHSYVDTEAPLIEHFARMPALKLVKMTEEPDLAELRAQLHARGCELELHSAFNVFRLPSNDSDESSNSDVSDGSTNAIAQALLEGGEW